MASCLTDDQITQLQFARRVRAINALQMINSDPVSEALRNKLTPLARRVPEANVQRIVQLTASISDADAHLELDVLMRVRTYITHASSNEVVGFIRYPLIAPQFRDAVRPRVSDLLHAALKHIFAIEQQEPLADFPEPPPEIFGQLVALYVSSTSWNNSNALATTLIGPYAAWMNADQVSRILVAFLTNRELSGVG